MFHKLKIPALIICISLFMSCDGKSDTDEEYPGNQIDMADPATVPDSSKQDMDTAQTNTSTGPGNNTIDRDPVNKGEVIDTMSSQTQ